MRYIRILNELSLTTCEYNRHKADEELSSALLLNKMTHLHVSHDYDLITFFINIMKIIEFITSGEFFSRCN